VKKVVKGPDYIDDDEHNKNQMLLGLGCVLVAIGAPIIGFFGKKVDKGEGPDPASTTVTVYQRTRIST
jgi:hypothetical protein